MKLYKKLIFYIILNKSPFQMMKLCIIQYEKYIALLRSIYIKCSVKKKIIIIFVNLLIVANAGNVEDKFYIIIFPLTIEKIEVPLSGRKEYVYTFSKSESAVSVNHC